jgi:integrase
VADEPAATLTRSQAFDLLELHAGIPVQAAKLRTELGAAWDYALDAGRLPDSAPNWWRQVMRGRLRSKGHRIAGKRVTAKRVLREPEVAALVRWLPNFSRNVADVLTLYLWTGARGAELVQMEAHEVTDEADGLWWTCPKVKTKNARHEAASDLRVPLLGEAERVVRRRLGVHPKGWLFPAARGAGHLEQKAVQTAVHFRQPYSKTRPKDERPRLPVTHWAPHDLRRTVRTMLASMGCPDTVAEAVLGHMQPGVQGVYNLHQYDRERRLWLGKLSDRLQALAS